MTGDQRRTISQKKNKKNTTSTNTNLRPRIFKNVKIVTTKNDRYTLSITISSVFFIYLLSKL